jgi:hypothetical protein
MKLAGPVFAMAVMATTLEARAQTDTFFDGEDLKITCRDYLAAPGTPATISAGRCLGYVEGVIDEALDTADPARKICFPKNVPSTALAEIVVNYLANNPQNRQYTAASIVVRALQEAYACPLKT